MIIPALQPNAAGGLMNVRRYVRLRSNPRGVQALCLAGCSVALLDGRYGLAYSDVRAVARPTPRRRSGRSVDAEQQSISSDVVSDEALTRTPQRSS